MRADLPMRIVNVPLAVRSYDIHIGSGVMDQLAAQCSAFRLGPKCTIISDRNVARRYAPKCVRILKAAGFDPALISVPAGEPSKSLRVVQHCYDQLAKQRVERRSFVIALGGGVVGDLAGFVAATYLRGVALVQVPTTLLAQVDSSVGGKVGVNLKAGKNLVGAFFQPRVVLCDLDALRTLPPREFRAGLAEVIKYGIIHDPPLFEQLERDMPRIIAKNADVLEAIIARCCEIKAQIVSQDETESGLRAILNFGHTIGHAIEAISGYRKFLHGEAISIGQVAAAHLSAMHAGLPKSDAERIAILFKRAGLPTTIKLSRQKLKQLHKAMLLDKKVSAGEIKFVLAERIGKVHWGQSVPSEAVDQVLFA
ncbi:MAG TPA: 3-dehydroquinate synthase [Candidatus Binatia bacterium]|nr:3-dehydroquinate synthase [Candidatus Binatia bacterium]